MSSLTNLCNRCGFHLNRLIFQDVQNDVTVCIWQRIIVVHLCVHFEVRHEDTAGYKDISTCFGALMGKENNIARLNHLGVWLILTVTDDFAIIILAIYGIGGVKTANQGFCLIHQFRCACIGNIHATSAVLAVLLFCRNAGHELTIHVEVGWVQTICLSSVIYFIIDLITVHANGRSNSLQQLILLNCC